MNLLQEALSDKAISEVGLVATKCLIGLVLGAAIGLERQVEGHAAGMRTHMLLVLGAVLFGESSRYFGGPDPSRIAAQIVSGVGFLGAGAILRIGYEVKGLTTAATIWAAAAIGLAVSAGGPMLLAAAIGTVFILITLTIVERFEKAMDIKHVGAELSIEVESNDVVSDILQLLGEKRAVVSGIRLIRNNGVSQLIIKLANRQQDVLKDISAIPGVNQAHWVAVRQKAGKAD